VILAFTDDDLACIYIYVQGQLIHEKLLLYITIRLGTLLRQQTTNNKRLRPPSLFVVVVRCRCFVRSFFFVGSFFLPPSNQSIVRLSFVPSFALWLLSFVGLLASRFIHSFIHSFVRSLVRSFVDSFVRSLMVRVVCQVVAFMERQETREDLSGLMPNQRCTRDVNGDSQGEIRRATRREMHQTNGPAGTGTTTTTGRYTCNATSYGAVSGLTLTTRRAKSAAMQEWMCEECMSHPPHCSEDATTIGRGE